MPPLLLIAAAGIAGLVLFGGSGSGAPGARRYTRADIPKLRELMLSKVYLGRELRNCLTKQSEHSLFNAQQTIAFGVGLFTSVATLDPATGLKAARAASAAYDKLGGGSAPACQKEIELTAQQLRQHDQVCAELGLPTDVTYERVQAIVAQLGGLEIAGVHDPNDANDTLNNWDRCVRASGVYSCESYWRTDPGHAPVPKYDKKTGLAIR